jgi:hypothetical protein
MDNLLYFPYINLPKSNWSIRTLLYYDTISTIVPEEYNSEPKQYEPFMAELIKNRLVIPVNPNHVLHRPYELADSFLNYMVSGTVNLEKRRKGFKIAGGRKGIVNEYSELPKIHNGKFDNNLFNGLRDLGLAERLSKDFYLVEKKTADELMTYLASIISIKLKLLPSTDTLKRKAFKATNLKNKFVKLYEREKDKRELILQKLIPCPMEIDLSRVRKFKDENYTLLKNFKNKVELIALDGSIDKDSDIFNEKLKELEIQKNEIAVKMNESRMANVFISVSGIIGALPGLNAQTREEIALGLIGLAGTVVAAANIESPEKVFGQNGLKYIVLANSYLRKK